jgi:hypothetical protein
MRTVDITSRESLQAIGRQLQSDQETYLAIDQPCAERQHARLRCHGPGGLTNVLPIQYAITWSAEWARLAYPLIQPSHIYGAALMATQVPRDIDIRPPWPVFMLAVPDNLVHLINRDGEEEAIRFMLCYWQESRWTFMAPATTVEFSRTCLTLDDLCRDRLGVDGGGWDWGESEETVEVLNLVRSPAPILDQDERAAQMLSRLLLNACLAMSDPTAVRKVGKAHEWRIGSPLPKGPRVFELRRPVSVDCRQTIRQFISGGSRIPAVQWLVRGHWRNQAYGIAHSQRRLTWIEPHWKGVEDAPLAIRPHNLKG